MGQKPAAQKVVFDLLRSSLMKQCPPMVCSKDTGDKFEIVGNTPVPYGSTKKIIPGMYFASVAVRKQMVSMYFFPIYYHQRDFAEVAPTLLKRLKGKACFNFTRAEQIDIKELDALLRRGVRAWKKIGYVT